MNETIIKLWKEVGITSATFEFDCGGDSMNTSEVKLYRGKGND